MSLARQLRYSYEDYLRALEESELKLEYSAGVIYAMAGGTLAHAQLSANVTAALKAKLKRNCAVYSADAKVRVESSDFAGFPDVSVVCGDRQTSRVDAHALTNPTLLVEVTSRSTEDYDRGDKLAHYQRLSSLKAVLFVAHDERAITIVERRGRKWTSRVVRAGGRVVLADPALSFDVDAIYEDVELD
jgi:Uma2 family endonuclease